MREGTSAMGVRIARTGRLGKGAGGLQLVSPDRLHMNQVRRLSTAHTETECVQARARLSLRVASYTLFGVEHDRLARAHTHDTRVARTLAAMARVCIGGLVWVRAEEWDARARRQVVRQQTQLCLQRRLCALSPAPPTHPRTHTHTHTHTRGKLTVT
jgi:hypothetical protein